MSYQQYLYPDTLQFYGPYQKNKTTSAKLHEVRNYCILPHTMRQPVGINLFLLINARYLLRIRVCIKGRTLTPNPGAVLATETLMTETISTDQLPLKRHEKLSTSVALDAKNVICLKPYIWLLDIVFVTLCLSPVFRTKLSNLLSLARFKIFPKFAFQISIHFA